MKKISIVIPCYNEQEMIPLFYEEVKKNEEKFNNVLFEYIFINDGSSDNTLKEIKNISSQDTSIKYISFSRNFGKEAAMLAGLRKASGDYIAVMDVDLQDPPELLLEMYNTLEEGEYDCVATRRATRKGEPIIRSFFAHTFYKIINKLSDIQIVDGARDYRLMTRQMLDAILEVTEYNRFSKGIFSFVGFNTKWISYDNINRKAGKTKWSFFKLLKYSLEGITAFSTAPLVMSAILGIIFCIISFLMIVVIILKTLIFGDPTSGWPSLACIIFMVSGIQLLSIGVIGQYLAKTYLESKKRPIYIIKETDENKKNI